MPSRLGRSLRSARLPCIFEMVWSRARCGARCSAPSTTLRSDNQSTWSLFWGSSFLTHTLGRRDRLCVCFYSMCDRCASETALGAKVAPGSRCLPEVRSTARAARLSAVVPGAGLFVALGTSTCLRGGEANARRKVWCSCDPAYFDLYRSDLLVLE